MQSLASNSPRIRSSWKLQFESELDNFIEIQRSSDINWKPTRLKVRGIVISRDGQKYAVVLKDDTGSKYQFSVFKPPEHDNLRFLDIRKWINSRCVDRGFKPYTPRENPSSSETIQGIRVLDAEAWNKWVGRNYKHWLTRAEREISELKAAGGRPLVDADDAVSQAMSNLVERLKAGHVVDYPYSFISQTVTWHIHAAEKFYHRDGISIAAQSNEAKVSAGRVGLWHELITAPRESTYIRIEHIHKLYKDIEPFLSDNMRELMEFLLTDFSAQVLKLDKQEIQSYKPPRQSEIGKNLHKPDGTTMSRGTANLLLRGAKNKKPIGISERLHEAARAAKIDGSETDALINYIDRLYMPDK